MTHKQHTHMGAHTHVSITYVYSHKQSFQLHISINVNIIKLPQAVFQMLFCVCSAAFALCHAFLLECVYADSLGTTIQTWKDD